MAFTAQDVKTLREMTGVGMMDGKKALTESNGDMDKAVEWLREKGMAASAKKAGRIAAEGMAYASVIDGVGGNKFAPRATTESEEATGYAQATREQAILIAKRMVQKLG